VHLLPEKAGFFYQFLKRLDAQTKTRASYKTPVFKVMLHHAQGLIKPVRILQQV